VGPAAAVASGNEGSVTQLPGVLGGRSLKALRNRLRSRKKTANYKPEKTSLDCVKCDTQALPFRLSELRVCRPTRSVFFLNSSCHMNMFKIDHLLTCRVKTQARALLQLTDETMIEMRLMSRFEDTSEAAAHTPGNSASCDICRRRLKGSDHCTLQCQHSFHAECFHEELQQLNEDIGCMKTACPVCRAELHAFLAKVLLRKNQTKKHRQTHSSWSFLPWQAAESN
jgi:hypothetical protein